MPSTNQSRLFTPHTGCHTTFPANQCRLCLVSCPSHPSPLSAGCWSVAFMEKWVSHPISQEEVGRMFWSEPLTAPGTSALFLKHSHVREWPGCLLGIFRKAAALSGLRGSPLNPFCSLCRSCSSASQPLSTCSSSGEEDSRAQYLRLSVMHAVDSRSVGQDCPCLASPQLGCHG